MERCAFWAGRPLNLTKIVITLTFLMFWATSVMWCQGKLVWACQQDIYNVAAFRQFYSVSSEQRAITITSLKLSDPCQVYTYYITVVKCNTWSKQITTVCCSSCTKISLPHTDRVVQSQTRTWQTAWKLRAVISVTRARQEKIIPK